jgi:hypothetical protein
LRWAFAALVASSAADVNGLSRPLSPDEEAVRTFVLDAPTLRRLFDGAVALRDLAARDPRYRDRSGTGTVEEKVRHLERYPEIVSALERAGTTPRELVVGTLAVRQAAMWSNARKQSPGAPLPPEVNPENVKFADQHPEAMRKWQLALSRERREPTNRPDQAPRSKEQ